MINSSLHVPPSCWRGSHISVRVVERPLKWSEREETRVRKRFTRLAFPAPCSLQPQSSSPITNTRYSSSGPCITLYTLLPVRLTVKPIGMGRRPLKVWMVGSEACDFLVWSSLQPQSFLSMPSFHYQKNPPWFVKTSSPRQILTLQN